MTLHRIAPEGRAVGRFQKSRVIHCEGVGDWHRPTRRDRSTMADIDGAPSDGELLDSWQAGDRRAGDRLLGRYFRTVYRFFRRRFDEQTAEDLTQLTFEATFKLRDRVYDGASFKVFVLGVARNHLMRHLRRMDRSAAKRRRAPPSPPTQTSPSRMVAAREEQRLILQALAELPLDLQMTIELHYWEQLTTREIADVLGIAAGTVKWRLSRARAQLKESILASSASAQVRESTAHRLDHWAQSLREGPAETGEPSPK